MMWLKCSVFSVQGGGRSPEGRHDVAAVFSVQCSGGGGVRVQWLQVQEADGGV